MCASRKPFTQPQGEAAFDGAPVTPVSDSGNAVQPSAFVKPNVVPAPKVSSGPVAVSFEPPLLSVNAPVVPSTTQSAAGPGASAVPTVLAPVFARNLRSFV